MTSTGRRLKERIGQDKEVAPATSPRDGRELWSDKEEHEAEAGTRLFLYY